jgi:hypothetical protein
MRAYPVDRSGISSFSIDGVWPAGASQAAASRRVDRAGKGAALRHRQDRAF